MNTGVSLLGPLTSLRAATSILIRRFLLIVFVLSAAGSGTAQPAHPRDLATIRSAGTLRVAITRFDLPAFRWREGESFAGPEADLAHQIASALGVGITFVNDADSFDAVVDAVAEGRADIGISKLSQTYYRLLRVRFSQPYLTLHHALLFERASVAALAAGHPLDDTLRHFHGRIGVISGSAYAEAVHRNFPDADILGLNSWNAVIRALKERRVDAIYRDEFEIKRVLQLSPALNVRFGAAIITDQFALLSVAICDSCAKLQEMIDYHLTQTVGTFNLPALLASDLRE
jgi:ABC-type amino acid transport substrate-binding protein